MLVYTWLNVWAYLQIGEIVDFEILSAEPVNSVFYYVSIAYKPSAMYLGFILSLSCWLHFVSKRFLQIQNGNKFFFTYTVEHWPGIEPGTSSTQSGCVTTAPPSQLRESIVIFNCYDAMERKVNKQSRICGPHIFNKFNFSLIIWHAWITIFGRS